MVNTDWLTAPKFLPVLVSTGGHKNDEAKKAKELVTCQPKLRIHLVGLIQDQIMQENPWEEQQKHADWQKVGLRHANHLGPHIHMAFFCSVIHIVSTKLLPLIQTVC